MYVGVGAAVKDTRIRVLYSAKFRRDGVLYNGKHIYLCISSVDVKCGAKKRTVSRWKQIKIRMKDS